MAMASAANEKKGDWIPSGKQITLKTGVRPNDKDFDFEYEESDLYEVEAEPNAINKPSRKISSIQMKCIRITKHDIVLSRENICPTRMTSEDPEKFICLSFAKLKFGRFKHELTSRYIQRVLTTGIKINGVLYEFFGHSNSQLRSRVCYLRASYDTPRLNWFGFGCFGKRRRSMDELINTKGNFDNYNIAKRAKRIGLLFSSATSTFKLNSKETQTIGDKIRRGKNFTDGCGFIDANYARELVEEMDDSIWKKNCNASVLQIRYKGFKGILLAVPTAEIQRLSFEDKHPLVKCFLTFKSWIPGAKPEPTTKVLFRDSMKKFDKCSEETLCIVEHSKPFTYGYLNAELITLLASLGIPDSVFQRKLTWYLNLIQDCLSDIKSALELCVFKNKIDMVQQLKEVVHSIPENLLPSLTKLRTDEADSFYKEGKVKTRILIPKSRLIFGVSDPTGKLKPGECFGKITETLINETDENHYKVEKLYGNIIVSRNPCLHPGDIQYFTAVDIPELDCLQIQECIVFSVKGDTPAASTMSGGDLDGDKFFVCWDAELIPHDENRYPPEDYSKYIPEQQVKEEDVTQQDLIKHFSFYNTFQLGELKFLYLKWVFGTRQRALSQQCIELNRLYSLSVDGGTVKVPNALRAFPYSTQKEFVLKTLEREIMKTFPCVVITPEKEEEDLENLDYCDDIPVTKGNSNEYWILSIFRKIAKVCCGREMVYLAIILHTWMNLSYEYDI